MKKVLPIIVLLISLISIVFISGCEHEHNWIDPTCYSPKTCIKCEATEGYPAPHAWVEATCIRPKHCAFCGITEGGALGHDWSEEAFDIPSQCYNCGELSPLVLPYSGQVFIGKDLYRGSEIKITSNTTQSCYIKLKGSSGIDVFSFFVRANSTVTVDVPQGYYYVYFSYGDDWYGTEYLFGEKTTYAKDDELLDFENYTWEYTLTPVVGGNFSETPIDAEEFK